MSSATGKNIHKQGCDFSTVVKRFMMLYRSRRPYIMQPHAGIAQLVEQLTCNQ